MKANLHPVQVDCKVTCACGNEFNIKSNKATMSVEVCDKCHPFYSGQQGATRRKGNVEKFNKKWNIKN